MNRPGKDVVVLDLDVRADPGHTPIVHAWAVRAQAEAPGLRPMGAMSRRPWPRRHGMRIVITEFMSLDGVVQAPGGPEEDTDGGFGHGGRLRRPALVSALRW